MKWRTEGGEVAWLDRDDHDQFQSVISSFPSLLALPSLLLRPPSAHPSPALGCKIKALRAKTNTYIKTPVRGEEPVFVVTGRHEDVVEAKREIECAAEHFTQIRASRRHSQVRIQIRVGSGRLRGRGHPTNPFPHLPGRVSGAGPRDCLCAGALARGRTGGGAEGEHHQADPTGLSVRPRPPITDQLRPFRTPTLT